MTTQPIDADTGYTRKPSTHNAALTEVGVVQIDDRPVPIEKGIIHRVATNRQHVSAAGSDMELVS